MASLYTDEYGPNVQNILCGGSRVIRGRVPAQVRAELRKAVQAGVLGHLKRDGLKPEVFYNPNNKVSALDRQQREAAYAVKCIASVIYVKSADERIGEALVSLSKQEA